MNISQRVKDEYLASMGIDIWYPRAQLAQSKSAIQFENIDTHSLEVTLQRQEFPEIPIIPITKTKEETAVSTNEQDTADRPTASTQNLQESMAELAKTDADNAQIRFGLGLYVLGDYLIVSSLTGDYVSLQESSSKLLHNILKLLDGSSHEMTHHHVIAWPFFSNPHADQGVEEARQYVMSIVEQFKIKHKTTRMLVFGGVLPKLNHWDSLTGRVLGMNWLLLPSLYKMLNQPSLKAKAWSLIKESSSYTQS